MASNLPDYVASAQPVPPDKRIPWYSSTAQTYAGIMLWFVFWDDVTTGGFPTPPPGGMLIHGLGVAFIGLIAAALLCHFLYYLVPGMLGLKTGLPLYIVGTSTYGVRGGFIMPGFLMGLLQFGWLGVNAFFAGIMLCQPWLAENTPLVGHPAHIVVCILWAGAAAFMGLKGIQYVAKVATFLPLIPLAVLIILFFATVGGIAKFDPQKSFTTPTAAAAETAAQPAEVQAAETLEKTTEVTPAAAGPMSSTAVITIIMIYIIGFFATAGAAGADFGMNNRNAKDVHLGGLVGITGATIFAGGLALLITAGAYGLGKGAAVGSLKPTALMEAVLGSKTLSTVFMYLLAIAAFPPACFSAFIAANSFKTTLPKINPFITVGIGTIVSIALAVTGIAGNLGGVFTIIGASFGPICGAMAADYLLAGCKWAGPRAGFNLAGWISWFVGFVVGASLLVASTIDTYLKDADAQASLTATLGKVGTVFHSIADTVMVPPLAALIVGFVLYLVLALIGLQGKTLDMPQLKQQG